MVIEFLTKVQPKYMTIHPREYHEHEINMVTMKHHSKELLWCILNYSYVFNKNDYQTVPQ